MTRRKSESQQAYREDGERRREETQHGTVAGYMRHLHDLTDACDACTTEWRLFSATPAATNVKRTHTP